LRRLISSILMVFILLTVVGCSSSQPDEIVNTFLKAAVKADYLTMAKLVRGADANIFYTPEDEGAQEVIEAILGRVTYQVGEKQISGNTATVKAKIVAPDLLRITALALPELMSMAFAMFFSQEVASQDEIDALFMQYFENAIKDPEAPMVESNISIKLEKKGAGWVIVPDDELANALTGNMTKAFAEIGN